MYGRRSHMYECDSRGSGVASHEHPPACPPKEMASSANVLEVASVYQNCDIPKSSETSMGEEFEVWHIARGWAESHARRKFRVRLSANPATRKREATISEIVAPTFVSEVSDLDGGGGGETVCSRAALVAGDKSAKSAGSRRLELI